MNNPIPFYLVSDGEEPAAGALLAAALRECGVLEPHIERVPLVRTRQEIVAAYQAAQEAGAIVAHLLGSSGLRQVAAHCSRTSNVPSIDLIGPVIVRLTDLLEVTPGQKPELFRQIDEDYFRRIEAIEFAVAHDDGLRLNDLHRAEIVLTGVSRTSKTPLCMYMASRGWLAANVPLVLDTEPPAALFEVEPYKVVALVIRPDRLSMLRHARITRLGLIAPDNYADVEYVRAELRQAEEVFKRGRWTVLDVTSKSIEESASEIIQILNEHDPGVPRHC